MEGKLVKNIPELNCVIYETETEIILYSTIDNTELKREPHGCIKTIINVAKKVHQLHEEAKCTKQSK